MFGRNPARTPRFSVVQLRPPSRVSKAPTALIPTMRCLAFRGSTSTECRQSPPPARLPLLPRRMIVQRIQIVPRIPAVVTAEQGRGLHAGVDRVRRFRRSRFDVPDPGHAEVGSLLELGGGLRRLRLLPCAAVLDRRSPRFATNRGGRVDGSAVPRVQDHVIDGPALHERARDRPFLPIRRMEKESPFFVPTATTTLPFLIERAMSTTGDAGEDVDDVSRIQSRFRTRTLG